MAWPATCTIAPTSASGFPKPIAERDHAHVLEAGVGQQALPGQRAPEERHRDGQRGEAEEDEDVRAVAEPTAAASAC